MLAHGWPVGRAHRQRFGLALHSSRNGELEAVFPEDFAKALAPLAKQPVIVTMAACDSANKTNTINNAGSFGIKIKNL